MIKQTSAKQLNILLPNTNKALKEVLKDISPQDLETINSGKDIKSILTSLLDGAIKNQKDNKLLLELLKNNPTLKKIGSLSNTINDLLKSLKNDKEPLPIEKNLKEFLVNIKDLDEKVLKKQISDSGVFFESKLKDVKNPQVELKNILTDLKQNLKSLQDKDTKEIFTKIDNLLSKDPLKSATSSDILVKQNPDQKILQNITKEVKSIISSLTNLSSKNIETKDLLNDLKNTLSKLQDTKDPNVKEFTKLIENLTQLLKSSTSSKSQILQLTYDLTSKLEITSQENSTNIKTQQLPTDQASTKEIIKDLKNTLSKFQTSSNIEQLSKKLSHFSEANKLHPNQNSKEIVEHDLKPILLKAHEEISASSNPNKNEILKHIDKLLMQIDYNQLVSSLSNSNSLYIPFSWEEMEDGHIEIHQKEDKFYCDIELTLKEHGEVKVRLALYEKNQLSIYLHSEDTQFRSKLKSKSDELKKALFDIGLNAREIRVFDNQNKKDTKAQIYKNNLNDNIDMGFNLKI